MNYPKCPVCKHAHPIGPDHVWEECTDAVLDTFAETPKPPTTDISKPSVFDRRTYQRNYMRDLPLAKKEGLTVKQWRVKHGKDDS